MREITKKIFKKYSSEIIDDEISQNIEENLSAFFSLLLTWQENAERKTLS